MRARTRLGAEPGRASAWLDEAMEGEFEKALRVLERYISPFNARTVLMRALQDAGVLPRDATRSDLRKCSAALRRAVTLFVETTRQTQALSEISELCGSDSLRPEACALEIRLESDISKARAEARRICDAFRATPFSMQRLATIVSELTRNMVLYAGGGLLEIVPANSASRVIVVRAEDRGTGISNLQEVLSGRYKSKTGMGKGLLGTKRLADKFDVTTSNQGTCVVVEVVL